jgi:hypothetical protein
LVAEPGLQEVLLHFDPHHSSSDPPALDQIAKSCRAAPEADV